MKSNQFKAQAGTTAPCPITHAMAKVGGKWKFRILDALIHESPKRFTVLQRELTGISPTMLTSQLRELESDGLIHRQVFATVPPAVEYRLTVFGESTIPMMAGIREWGLQHMGRKPGSADLKPGIARPIASTFKEVNAYP